MEPSCSNSQNQFPRVNNQAGGFTHTWTYDDAGNITSRKEYGYTTGTLGSALSTRDYTYSTSGWGDLLTGYNGNTVTSDAIGNTLSDGRRTYTWEHGRELATVAYNGSTWTNTYDAEGMRIKRTNGSTTYTYGYTGDKLTYLKRGASTVLYFGYDASGRPAFLRYNGNFYYYITNLQGDVLAITDRYGTVVVTYTYDAWGNILTTTGSMATSLGAWNPLRYRGYVYDRETGLYYLQSRYYDPENGRFLSHDIVFDYNAGLQGYDLFVYCGNNPINRIDSSGADSEEIDDVGLVDDEYELFGSSGKGGASSNATAKGASVKAGGKSPGYIVSKEKTAEQFLIDNGEPPKKVS